MGFFKPGNGKLIPLGEFAPDLPLSTPGIILDATNALPMMAGFKPMPSLDTLTTTALPSRPTGAVRAYYSDESTALFAGTLTHLYLWSGTGWVAADSTTYAATGPWVFSQFGDDVIAVAPGVAPQVAAAKAVTFAGLAGSPPSSAVSVLSISAQVLMFKAGDWYSSAVGTDNNWTLSVSLLAGTNTLYDYPGPVVASAPIFRSALAFKKNAIWLGQQSGPPFSWSWGLISGETGTWSQSCVITGPDFVAFLGIDDFWITQGYTPQRIPNNVKEWFFKNLNGTFIGSTLGWYDAFNSVLYWHFVSTNAPNPPTCDLFVSYNVRAKRWCTGHMAVSAIPYLNVASSEIPLPVTAFAPIILDDNFKARRLSGASAGMSITTGYMGLPGRKSQLQKVRPEYNTYPTSDQLVPYHVNALGKADQQTENAVLDSDGAYYLGQVDRYHKLLLSTKGDCEIIGFTPEFRDAGIN